MDDFLQQDPLAHCLANLLLEASKRNSFALYVIRVINLTKTMAKRSNRSHTP